MAGVAKRQSIENLLGLGLGLGLGFGLGRVALLEAIDAAGGIDELVLAGIERVAVGADTDLGVLLEGLHLVDDTTGTGDRGLDVFGVDFFLHGDCILLLPADSWGTRTAVVHLNFKDGCLI